MVVVVGDGPSVGLGWVVGGGECGGVGGGVHRMLAKMGQVGIRALSERQER